jgi:hypothetical protein
VKVPKRAAKDVEVPDFSPALGRFVENVGTYLESQGVPRIGGRILGLLLVTQQPLTAEEIARALRVSRGSVSTNIRLLVVGGLIEKASLPGSRATYHVFSDTAWERRSLAILQTVASFRRIAEQGLTSIPPGHPARSRLEKAIDWADHLNRIFNTSLREWNVQQGREARGTLEDGSVSQIS